MKILFVLMILFSSMVVFGQESDSKDVIPVQITELPKSKINFKPKLPMQKAFKLMKKFIKKQKIDTSKYYLSSVTMFQYGGKKSKKPMWLFAWGHESGALGNYLHIIIDMDGNARATPDYVVAGTVFASCRTPPDSYFLALCFQLLFINGRSKIRWKK